RAEDEDLQVVVVPDRHGTGTNALLLCPPDALAPSFGPGSLERHVGAAEAAGLRYAIHPLPSLGLDVDTADDLAELAVLLEQCRGRAPMTRGVLRQLDRLRSRPSPQRARPALQV
ncbi:MAG TPA: hypothetical protein VHN78_06480, partial [Chloroflexota bacterium]|nr:hypothetical protein [Chloroflexota bacterium]